MPARVPTTATSAQRFKEGGASLGWTEVFAAGRHRDKDYSPADLSDIATNFNRYSTGPDAVLKVPAVRGHGEDGQELDDDGEPAAGWGAQMRHVVRTCPACKGKGQVPGRTADKPCPLCAGKGRRHVLEQRFRDLSPAMKRDLDDKAFAEISAEIYDEPPPGHPGNGKVLRRVAFLGGEVPQIKGLKSAPRAEAHAEARPWTGVAVRLVRAAEVARTPGLWRCFSEVRKYCGGEGGKPGPCPEGAGEGGGLEKARAEAAAGRMPLPQAKRPYKYDGNERHKAINNADLPVSQLDPSSLTATQDFTVGFKSAAMKGPLRQDQPILVIRHGGKDYIEEGHHRAIHGLLTGQKVPAKVMTIGADGKYVPAAPHVPAAAPHGETLPRKKTPVRQHAEVTRMAGTAHDSATGQFTGAGAKSAHAAAGKASAASSSEADAVSQAAQVATRAARKAPSDESHRAAGAAHQAARKAHEGEASKWSGRSSGAAAGTAALHKKAAEAHRQAADEHHQAAQEIKPIYHAEGDMDRDQMIQELAQRGISEEIASGCGDAQLAEWLRSLDSGGGGEPAAADPAAAPEEPAAPGDEEDFDDGDVTGEAMDEDGDNPAPAAKPADAQLAEDGQPVDIDVKKMKARAKAWGEAQSKAMLDKYCSEPGKTELAEGEEVSAVTAAAKKPDPKAPEKMSERRIAAIVRAEVEKALKGDTGKSIAELQKFREETTIGAKRDSVDAIIAAAAKDGRLPPSMAPHYHRLLMKADARATVEKFKEASGKTRDLTEFDQITRDLEKLPTLFKERAKGGSGPDAGTTEDAEVEAVKQHFESFKENFPRGAKVETLVDGFKAARKHDDQLTAAKFLQG